MRHLSIILCTVWIVLLGLVPGHAQTRVALIIGNGAYKNVAALPNPPSDARDVAASFGRLGFVATTLTDAGFDQMRRALLDFGRRARGAEIAVVYFAGHGMEVGGENWLIPTDADLRTDTDTENEAVSLRSVMLQVSGATKLGMVILDACRNNPFAAKMQRSARLRAVDRGFVRIEPTDNVLVAYAARDGTTASDGNGRNSPFTAALLKNIETPSLEIRFLFAKVRDDVMSATNRQQQPFTYQSLAAQEIFLRERIAAVAAPPIQPPVPPRLPTASDPCAGPVTVSFPSRCAAPLAAVQERGLNPKDSFKECEHCPEMVVVPAGSFTMGSPANEKDRFDNEGPPHLVRFAKPFAVGKFHVTVDEFDAFVAETNYGTGPCLTRDGSDASWRNPGFAQAGSHPVVCLNWIDANAYVEWLARKTGKSYRLLTEAEWEYAARAQTRPGSYPRYWFGNNDNDLCRYGNVADQKAHDKVTWAKDRRFSPCNDGYAYTSPAGSFPANGFGLYDMLGNASQMTVDCSHSNYDGAPTDGSAWTDGDCRWRRLRGGSWLYEPARLRIAHRASNAIEPTTGDHIRSWTIGFRVGRTLTR